MFLILLSAGLQQYLDWIFMYSCWYCTMYIFGATICCVLFLLLPVSLYTGVCSCTQYTCALRLFFYHNLFLFFETLMGQLLLCTFRSRPRVEAAKGELLLYPPFQELLGNFIPWMVELWLYPPTMILSTNYDWVHQLWLHLPTAIVSTNCDCSHLLWLHLPTAILFTYCGCVASI